jgi:hypothetical protein
MSNFIFRPGSPGPDSPCEQGKQNYFIKLSFLLLFAGFFYVFASANIWDYDFWWHLATGRNIVETHAIPDNDPFSFTTELKENQNLFPERKNFILKQYWLAQGIFYLLYNAAGPKGIILLRALLLTTVLFLVFLRLKKWKVNFYISFVFLFFLYMQLAKHTGERPVLFTILFTVVTFMLLEKFRETKGKALFLLCPVMLLWSNLHGGFIIGNILIMVYMFGEGIKIILKKVEYTRKEMTLFYSATALSLACSFLNPTGWDAFSIALSPEYKFMEAGIQEYQSPLYFYKHKIAPVNFGFVILMILFPSILLLRNKKLDLTQILLLTGLFIMAARVGRYAIFYSSIASMVLGRETNILIEEMFTGRLSRNTNKKITSVFTAVAVLSSLLFIVGVFKFEAFRFDIAKGVSIPKGSVDFIEKNRISGNLFNDGGYGGYIAWRLYPWKKTFVDTRWLSFTVQSEFGWIASLTESVYNKKLPDGKRPLWRRLLDHYSINLILLSTLDVYGNVVPICLELADDAEWVPVYGDRISLVFVKNNDKNLEIIKKFRLSKEYVYNILIAQSSWLAIYNRDSPQYTMSLGRIFYKMGRLKDALTALKYAYKRLPSEDVKEKISEIETELKERNTFERN